MSYPVEVKIVVQMRGEGSKATLPEVPDVNTGVNAFAAMELPTILSVWLSKMGSSQVDDETLASAQKTAAAIVPQAPGDVVSVDSQEVPELRAHVIREDEWKKRGGVWGYSFPLQEYDTSLKRWIPLERPMIVRRTKQGKTVEARVLARYLLQIHKQ